MSEAPSKLETPGWPAWAAPDCLVGQRGVYVFGFDDFVKIGYSTNIARASFYRPTFEIPTDHISCHLVIGNLGASQSR